jgi:hypothetical protein
MKIIIGILTAFLISILIYSYNVNSRMEVAMLIPQHVHESYIDELLLKRVKIVAIQGSGSMQPLIPAGDGITAWAVMHETLTYDDLKLGDLVVFVGDYYNIIHQISELTSEGWIATGSHNKHYDKVRVTRKNFYGVAKQVFIPDVESAK